MASWAAIGVLGVSSFLVVVPVCVRDAPPEPEIVPCGVVSAPVRDHRPPRPSPLPKRVTPKTVVQPAPAAPVHRRTVVAVEYSGGLSRQARLTFEDGTTTIVAAPNGTVLPTPPFEMPFGPGPSGP